MSALARAIKHGPMTVDAFFAWQKEQDELYELVDGVPVARWEAMVGTTRGHDTVTTNVQGQLYTQLRGSRCRTMSADTAINVAGGRVRRPDAAVECGPLDNAATSSANPRLVVEVLSPSTRQIDLTRKLEEYKDLATLDYILFLESQAVQAQLFARDGEGRWISANFDGREARIALPAIAVELAMADLYEGLTFDDDALVIGGGDP